MGLSKTDNFTTEQNELAAFAKALGHPARVAIIEYLSTQANCVCGSIVDAIPLAQATVSQHLKELKNAGLIQGSIEGNSICYCLNPEKWKKFKQMLEPTFTHIEQPVCC
ncbi:MAG TPA: metalloregulator ArsR/SmtB family transcription factor [Ignavibacteria bacterium]|nr:transcriptional regulator [Bacteroidota bacterium]HRE11031.1 metalloregulator ArsR/SmtB family transcription factor [Ignavibacteria bacterium]HRF65701.1 metalloregulator ArsR/SmtB family transcription factor [Ignavibacteria bacterium]HRJ04917.1 metalloregulator ArsR/SmtB family transcription factor [Ignavibacteria bacterium]